MFRPNFLEVYNMSLEKLIRLTERRVIPDIDTHAGWEPCAAHDRLPAIRELAIALLRDRLETHKPSDQLQPTIDDSMFHDYCVLCGEGIEDMGNNPEPVSSVGRCCDDCNWNEVIPARIGLLNKEKIEKERPMTHEEFSGLTDMEMI